MASSCLSRRFEMPMDGERDSTELTHALAAVSGFEFRRSAGCAEVFQKCSKSVCKWVERGSVLSESRIPE